MEENEKIKQAKIGFLQALRALARRTGAVWNQEHDQPVIEAIDALVEALSPPAEDPPGPSRKRGSKEA